MAILNISVIHLKKQYHSRTGINNVASGKKKRRKLARRQKRKRTRNDERLRKLKGLPTSLITMQKMIVMMKS